MRKLELHLRGHALGFVLMDLDEFDILMGKMEDLEAACEKLKNRRADDNLGSTTPAQVAALRNDLGRTMKRIEELKEELSKCRDEAERYREEALRQIAEKKALYERVKG